MTGSARLPLRRFILPLVTLLLGLGTGVACTPQTSGGDDEPDASQRATNRGAWALTWSALTCCSHVGMEGWR